jgi:DnaJ-class molecular chaperone
MPSRPWPKLRLMKLSTSCWPKLSKSLWLNCNFLTLNSCFSDRVQREDRTRAFRRVARVVHPDKSQHPFAKEAFQKLLKCSLSLKNNIGSSIYYSYIIRILIKNLSAAATKTTGTIFGKKATAPRSGYKNFFSDFTRCHKAFCAAWLSSNWNTMSQIENELMSWNYA